MSDPLAELLAEELPQVPQPRWPHKCEKCGRFVSHDTLRSSVDGNGEYWSTAECPCSTKRQNAYPI